MSWLGMSRGAARDGADKARLDQWQSALQGGTLPPFVEERLEKAAEGRVPWLSTMSPAELLLARSHGIRPVATVSGTCWYHYGYSWTNGHAEGWHAALERMRLEAVAARANAIVDVKLRTLHLKSGPSMDYTVLGTAVRIDGLPPSPEPVIATVPALEFVRLLEAGIVPTGVAIGAHYDWLQTSLYQNLDRTGSWANQPLRELGSFWEQVRQRALLNLRHDAQRLGNGVLAHTNLGQLLKVEGGEQTPPRYLGRHIVIGTAVQCESNASVPHEITTVVDMRDALSPMRGGSPHGHSAYPINDDKEGSI